MSDIDEAAVIAELQKELEAHPAADVTLDAVSLFQLTGLVQLALRHPALPANLTRAAFNFLAAARRHFTGCPAALSIIARGDDPTQDRPADRSN